jgi:hypothetical protein
MHLCRDHGGSDSAARDHIIVHTHDFKITDQFPEIELRMEPCPAFSGVRILYDQHGCIHCPYIAGKKTVEKHMRDAHQDTRKKTRSGLASQVLNTGVCKAQFWVVEQLDNEPPTYITLWAPLFFVQMGMGFQQRNFRRYALEQEKRT